MACFVSSGGSCWSMARAICTMQPDTDKRARQQSIDGCDCGNPQDGVLARHIA
jgi:hypothetical protein